MRRSIRHALLSLFTLVSVVVMLSGVAVADAQAASRMRWRPPAKATAVTAAAKPTAKATTTTKTSTTTKTTTTATKPVATATPTPTATPAPCLLSDGSACPASYFTGPLGKNNILPNGTGGLLIDQYSGYGTTWEQTKTGLLTTEAKIGRRFDSIQILQNPDPAADGLDREQWLIDQGYAFVTVAWSPSWDIAAVNRGDADATITKAAKYYAAHKTRFMIRMWPEANLRSEVLNTNACGVPMQQAWQRVVKTFQANGATNVGFWYVPAEGNNEACIANSYPGDTYVDWTGSDSYNWCADGETNCWSTPLHSGPATFGELFNYNSTMKCPDGNNCKPSQLQLFGPRKPFIIGETGSIYAPNNSQHKATYLNSIATDAPKAKHLRGISLYDTDVTPVEGKRANFHLLAHGTKEELQAVRSLANHPWFTVGTRPAPKPVR